MFGRYNKLLLFCMTIGCVSSSVAVRADDAPVMTNMEVMTQLTGGAIQEIIDKVPLPPDAKDFKLVPYALDERYDFIDNVFARILTERGYRVRASGPNPGGTPNNGTQAGLRIEYQAMDFNLVYPKIYRSYVVGGRTVERSADVILMAKVVDPSNDSIIWIGEAARSHRDQFDYSRLAEVEAGVFAFSKPPRQSTNWGKIAEPVVVSGIIVGLIYLFFSNQSDQ
jgi:hypothetical protein